MKNRIQGMLGVLCLGLISVPFAHADAVVGEEAPDFTLTDTEGQTHSLSDYKGQYVVLEWFNNGCPFVRKFYDAGEMQRLQKEYREQGIIWLMIGSSREGAQGYYEPADAARIKEENRAVPTAYLLDSSTEVARLYGALVTPHMYVINPEGILLYQGAIDSIRSAKRADIARAENYVVAALDAAMAGQEVQTKTSRPYGCSVKY